MALPNIAYNNFQAIQALGNNNDWNNIVPSQSQANYEANGLAIARDEFQPVWNNVLSTLINKIAKSVIQQSTMQNPLSPFMRGDFGMFGDTMEQIFVGLIKASTYNPDWEAGTPFKTEKPNVDSMFHRNPRREMYKISVYREDLAKAFRTEFGLSNLVNTIIGSITESNIAAQYIWAKRTFYQYLTNTTTPALPLRPEQRRNVSLPVDRATGEEFMIALKKAVLDLRFNNTNFNPKQAAQQTSASNLALFVHKDILPILDVKTFAGAFNLGKIEADVPIIPLDNFGGQTDCIAFLCDKEFFMLMNQMQRFEQIWNPEKLYTNIFFHIWENYSVSYFHNAIYFMSNTPVPFRSTGLEGYTMNTGFLSETGEPISETEKKKASKK